MTDFDISLRIDERVFQAALNALFPVRRPANRAALMVRFGGGEHEVLALHYDITVDRPEVRLAPGAMSVAVDLDVRLALGSERVGGLELPRELLCDRVQVAVRPEVSAAGVWLRIVKSDVPLKIPLGGGADGRVVEIARLDVADLVPELHVPLPHATRRTIDVRGRDLTVYTDPRIEIVAGALVVNAAVRFSAAPGGTLLAARNDTAVVDSDRLVRDIGESVSGVVERLGGAGRRVMGRLGRAGGIVKRAVDRLLPDGRSDPMITNDAPSDDEP